jgi:AAA+ ATPase superfamily predicted ATPase
MGTSLKLFDIAEDATNYTIVGDKKQGKTTLLKNLIKILKKLDVAVIAYDRLMQFNEVMPCYETVGNVPDGKDRQFCIQADSIENFCLLAETYRKMEHKEGRKIVVIFDELDTVYNQWGAISEDGATKTLLTEWIDYSRHRKVEMWGCVRRPQKIWAHYLEQSGRIYMFHTSGDLARKKLLDVVGSAQMIKAVQHLEPFRYIIYPDEVSDYDRPKGQQLSIDDNGA